MPAPEQILMLGQRFVGSPLMTEPKTEEVQLTLKQRLFSWPWRPLRKTKYVTTQTPCRNIICSNGIYYAHPAIIEEIKAQIAKRNGT
jgi:hypothetical protein